MKTTNDKGVQKTNSKVTKGIVKHFEQYIVANLSFLILSLQTNFENDNVYLLLNILINQNSDYMFPKLKISKKQILWELTNLV